MSFIDDILGTIPQDIGVVGKLIGGGGSSPPKAAPQCLQTQVSNDGDMAGCFPNVYALFDNLESEAPYITDPLQIITQANAIVQLLYNPQYFDQNRGGNSQNLLMQAKQIARARADTIIAAANARVAATVTVAPTVDPTTGLPVTAAATTTTTSNVVGTIAGYNITQNELIFGGLGGLALLLILTRK
jgi:hypothetical protein